MCRFGEVVPENSTWSMGSVGRMTVVLNKKKSPSKWPRLLSHKRKVPNMHFWFEMDEQHADALEDMKAEKDIHAVPSASAKDVNDDEEKEVIPKKEKPVDTKKPSEESSPPEPVSPEAQALMAEKERITKELKAKLNQFDEEIKKRKNAEDALMRETKANIDKEYDHLKEEARKAALELTSEIDSKLGTVLNSDNKSEL